VEQETLLCVAKTIHEFESDPARGSFKHWLLNLTRWRIADQFRRRPPGVATSPPGDATGTSTRTPTVERMAAPDQLEAAWEIEWKRNLLDTAIARLGRRVKPKHLQIFDLYSRRHWPAARVARELGVSLIQVYLVSHRLTKQLREEVKRLGQKLE
jgi:RNA polymerase sigma-70 factor (ECF subfamily)